MTQNIAAATSLIPQILYSGQLGSGDTTLYTVPAASALTIKSGTVCNVNSAGGGASPVAITITIIPSGGTSDGTHTVLNAYLLQSTDTLSLKGYLADMCLGPGDAIHALAGSSGVMDIVLTGIVSS